MHAHQIVNGVSPVGTLTSTREMRTLLQLWHPPQKVGDGAAALVIVRYGGALARVGSWPSMAENYDVARLNAMRTASYSKSMALADACVVEVRMKQKEGGCQWRILNGKESRTYARRSALRVVEKVPANIP
jgi:hypothetical protein